MKTLLLFFGLLLSFSSFAQWLHDNHFEFPSSTSDGFVRISSLKGLSAGVKWVNVYIVGNGKTEWNYFSVIEGERFDERIALRYGPGSYQFQILTSKNVDKQGQYAVEHQGTFHNSFSKVLDAIAPSTQVQSDSPEIIELAQSITQGFQTDLEKTKAIHDWVASHIPYDVDAYFSGTYVSKDWDALTVLKKKKAICFGYSNLVAALNRAVGIEAKVIIGDANVYQVGWTPHAWNKVLADGRWVSMDVTWDAGHVDFVKKTFQFALQHKYFDPSAMDFALTHRETN